MPTSPNSSPGACCSRRKYSPIDAPRLSVTSVVLDASAVLAIVNAEPGADLVRASLAGAIMSAVNYSEVLKKTVEHGGAVEDAAAFVRGLSIAVIPFDEALARSEERRVGKE